MKNWLILVAFAVLAMPNRASAAHAVATAVLSDNVVYYWAANESNIAAAEKTAIKACNAGAKQNKHVGKCKVLGSANGPKYIAFFHTEDGRSIGVASDVDRQEAANMAYANCLKHGSCPKTAAKLVFDEGQTPKLKEPMSSKAECSPPAGTVLSYSDRCANGDCVRTFENGCSKRFQAKYCFDPVQQQWAWKPDGC